MNCIATIGQTTGAAKPKHLPSLDHVTHYRLRVCVCVRMCEVLAYESVKCQADGMPIDETHRLKIMARPHKPQLAVFPPNHLNLVGTGTHTHTHRASGRKGSQRNSLNRFPTRLCHTVSTLNYLTISVRLGREWAEVSSFVQQPIVGIRSDACKPNWDGRVTEDVSGMLLLFHSAAHTHARTVALCPKCEVLALDIHLRRRAAQQPSTQFHQIGQTARYAAVCVCESVWVTVCHLSSLLNASSGWNSMLIGHNPKSQRANLCLFNTPQ